VLSKCQTCGMLYMGPPLGHVRDPNKQVRFVEAELTALLQAAGGTLPVIKKNDRGVYVMVETEAPSHAAPAPAAKAAAPATKAAAPAAAAKPAAPAAAKAAEHKTLGQNPNRQLFKRTTYVGVTDTGPVPGETFEQKVARLKALSAAAKQRQEEGGGEPVHAAEAAPAAAAESTPVATAAPAASAPPAAASGEHKPTGNADRTLFKRSTYCGVVDTGPVPGESFEQKVARLAALSAAAKQRAEGG
jgi:hypothetical protein